jgi:AcrR family transcriptional regulator
MAKRPLVDPPPEPAPQRVHAHHIVDAIVAAAIELKGEATLADIAERAGVGSASMHRYFPTLSSIFAEVSRRMFRSLLGHIRTELADRERPLCEIVHGVCRTAFVGGHVPIEFRRRMNLEIPLAWSHGASELAYQEILDEITMWLEQNLAEPPRDLAGRVFAAFACVRGTVSLFLLSPTSAPAMETMIAYTSEAALAVLVGGGSRRLLPRSAS